MPRCARGRADDGPGQPLAEMEPQLRAVLLVPALLLLLTQVHENTGQATSSAAAAACDGTLLPSGICNRRGAWPPLWPGSGLPPRSPSKPPYLDAPPAVINVSLGRQLFVDTFLIESMPGLQLLSHAATWHGEVLRATEPWEAWLPSIPKQDYPQGPLASGLAYPFSGGLWWDDQQERFRLWYLCGSEVATKRVGACYAESRDGLTWEKPLVGRGDVTGTNIVYEELFNGLVVWQDHTASNASERFKMATVPNSLKLQQFRLLSSADGLSWSERGTSGPIGDRSTFFYDPFRGKWVWSIKEYYNSARSRSFFEGADFFSSANWKACGKSSGQLQAQELCRQPGALEAHCPCPWTSADSADPTWPCVIMSTHILHWSCSVYAYLSVMRCAAQVQREAASAALQPRRRAVRIAHGRTLQRLPR